MADCQKRILGSLTTILGIFLAPPRRSYAYVPLEDPGEMALIREAAVYGDFRKRSLAPGEHGEGLFDTALLQPSMGRNLR